MSRYTGPRVRVMRALGVNLPGLSHKVIERRPYPPGQHGQARKKLSEYAVRLQEKQKLRYYYGVTEGQLRRVLRDAVASKQRGDKLIELLERRLDNAVFRAGFARTIPAARQLVSHGHVLVDGRRVDIASYRLGAGQQLTLSERAWKNPDVIAARSDATAPRASWLAIDENTRSARVVALPDPSSILFPLNVQLVIEFYA